MRLIFTFPTLHKVLSAEKALRTSQDEHLRCRPTPTPPGLSADICGMSLELMDPDYQDLALSSLARVNLSPRGVHRLEVQAPLD